MIDRDRLKELNNVLSFGALVGIRSTAGLKMTFPRSRIVSALFVLESLADKLPLIPARTEPASLLARGIAGGLGSSLLTRRSARSRLAYAAMGASSAIACACVAAKIRKEIDGKSRLLSTVLGFAEDAVVILQVLRKGQRVGSLG